MTEIDVPDWVVEAAEFAFCGTTQETMLTPEGSAVLREGMRAALTAALGAWVVPVGVRYRVAPNDACRSRPWVGPGIVAEWDRPPLTDSETLQHQSIYTLRQEKPE